jgi:hypothetical protein
MVNNLRDPDGPLLSGLPDYHAVFLHELVRGLKELAVYARAQAGCMDPVVFHGLITRIGALRDDLADELPPDPRTLSPGRQIIQFPRRSGRGEPI